MTKKDTGSDNYPDPSKGSRPTLRSRAEEVAQANTIQMPEILDAMSPEAMQRLLHDLRVHQIELEMQNEELRRTQEELETSRARYFDLYDLAPVGYFTLNGEGMVIEANLTFATLLGVARGALVKQPLSHFILPQDQDIFYRLRKQLIETGIPQVCDLRLLRANAPPLWARVEAKVVLDAESGSPLCRAVASDITERKQAEEAVRVSLLDKEALLKEIYHRVKNNLQTICTLLDLQSSQIEHPEARAALRGTQSRMQAMALIHESLFISKNLSQVDLAEYLKQLCTKLYDSQIARPSTIQLHVDLVPVSLEIGAAILCGLLVNELVSNSFKHAFPEGRSGDVRVELQLVDGGPALHLRVSDNGVGLPADFDLKRTGTLGLHLVSHITRQIGGRLEVSSRPGAVFGVVFTPEPARVKT